MVLTTLIIKKKIAMAKLCGFAIGVGATTLAIGGLYAASQMAKSRQGSAPALAPSQD